MIDHPEKPTNKPEKTGAVVRRLQKQGATFFTFSQLQRLMEGLGGNVKITKVQRILNKKR